MTPERYRQIGQLYHEASALTPDERAAFLDGACAGDPLLRQQVEALLIANDEAESFIEQPAMEVAAEMFATQQAGAMIGRAFGHYKMVSWLGAGGMGEVYLARDGKLGRQVALKLLPQEFTRDPQRIRRFQQEARAASSLNHPNIVTIYEIGEEGEAHYIASEYIEGLTLRQRLASSAMPLLQALDIAMQVASALAAAHEAGVIHRDIKPENLMLRKDGFVKVLDFGLAKLAEHPFANANRDQAIDSHASTKERVQTSAGVVLGTVTYMSPEQARGQQVDARTDIFSLGVVLYEMVAGRVPFEGKTASDTIAAILEKSPLPLVRYQPEVPEQVQWVVTKALRKEREERYQSAREMLSDLREVKQEFELKSKLERSASPEMNEAATVMQVARVSDGQASVVTANQLAAQTDEAAVRTTSSAEYLVSGIKRHKRGAVLLLAGVLAIATFMLIIWPKSSGPPPKVSTYKQVTSDNRLKSFFVTDGARIYFTTYDAISGGNYQVSAGGGESIPISNILQNATIWDISRDGTEFLLTVSTTDIGAWPLWVQPVLGSSPRRVGDVLAHCAAWSGDGKHIVYGNGSDLFLATADGSESRKLASVVGTTETPRWSPDGRTVRFTVLNNDNSRSLWEVGVDGSTAHPLLPGWNSTPAECCGNWTEDGRYYFFQSSRNGVTNIWAIREGGGFLQSRSEPMQVTSGPLDFSYPVISRDRKKLFAIGDLQRGELVRYDTKSSQLVPFMQGQSIEHVDFSRDGEWVTYVDYPERTLWRSRVDGTQRLRLTSTPMQSGVPRWSPDGRRIAFIGALPGLPWKAYIISAEGGSVQQVMPELRNEQDANWSPDGNQLVFGFTPAEVGSSRLGGIHILDLRTNQTSMLPGSEDLRSPRWSPDGRYISAHSTDNRKILLFELATQHWEDLSTRMAVVYPSWSRDSKYVYFGSNIEGSPAVVRVRVSDRQIEQVVSLKEVKIANGVFGPWVGLTPDDSPLMLRYTGTQEIYALDLDLP